MTFNGKKGSSKGAAEDPRFKLPAPKTSSAASRQFAHVLHRSTDQESDVEADMMAVYGEGEEYDEVEDSE